MVNNLTNAQVEDAVNSPFVYEKCENGIRIIEFHGNDDSVNVPGEIKGLPVVEIGYGAFASGAFSSVILPETITKIGDEAFNWCEKLREVHLPFGLKSIGNNSFVGCVSLESICIPESVQEVGIRAFCNTGLKNIEFNANMKEIPRGCFSSCTDINISIGEKITTICSYAFQNTSIKKCVFPQSVTEVEKRAFQDTRGSVAFQSMETTFHQESYICENPHSKPMMCRYPNHMAQSGKYLAYADLQVYCHPNSTAENYFVGYCQVSNDLSEYENK